LDACAKILARYPLCDRCLGRQFHLLDEEEDNQVVGSSLKRALYLEHSAQLHAGKLKSMKVLKHLASSGHRPSAISLRTRTGKDVEAEPCPICGGTLFEKVGELASRAKAELSNVQYRTFQLGSKIPRKTVRADDEIKMTYQLSHGENVKTEFNRLVAREFSRLARKVPVYSGEPDVSIIVNPTDGSVEVSPSPVYISGRYRKVKAGISQTRRRGANPLKSIEGMLADVFVRALKAADVKFHGAGREDVDALMLGKGRPFILEVDRPTRRRINLARVQRRFNSKFGRSVQVRGLRQASRSDVVRLKMGGERFDKRYRVILRVEQMPTEEKLREVEIMATDLVIDQRTPKRVAWRRADKVRRRRIRSLKLRKIDDKRLEAIVETQAGTYVKEFVTGDEGRTKPSLAELLNTATSWEALEVIQILGG
jgi:tRNA pseudouridine synthase 10